MTFPITSDSPLRFPGPPPAACDVVIIGGGVMGVMIAWHLAKRGLAVTLCEKGRIAGEQSSRNWGWIRQQGRDPAELPIMVESLRIWQSLAQEFGDALGFRQSGVMYLANTARDMDGFEAWLPHARANGVDTRMLSRAEVTRTLQGAKADWPGGLFTPSDARAEPWVAVPLLVTGAVARGVRVVEHCAVRGLDRAAGRVTGVFTEQGRIACDQAVLAGGAWSSLFARSEGVILPQLAVLASVAATPPMPEIYPGAAADNHFAFRRRADGGYSLAPGASHDFFPGPDALRHARLFLPVLKKDWRSMHLRPLAPAGYPDGWTTPRRWSADRPSPFEAIRILNPTPSRRALAAVQDAFARAFPALGRPQLRSTWAGMIDTMPDVVPVIDRVAAIPGLTIATGLSGHGFGIGPGMGRVVADLVAGNPAGHDLHRFRLARFSDGTRIAPGPAL
ncbi:MAG: FAD-binding oxidoreductase [Rhodobacter sp.]|nr:FAD-binding oxidoreductase [Rhodobacter sp.]MCA3461471.1 FAD-binding oxidoreductase [Rhodobacter sp.]MCA3464398.1 FAD-binding oxidoreductase [Rhodobacter sp.]MCA3468018.1 FAD-binding oxidoreductase [Rhodobacter sp.]MCA3472225.1 FAD-binding oxidoreductase [Rhodobacter sp.]